jgi:hypothetical protein
MGSFRIRDPVRSEEDEINTPQSVQATSTPGGETTMVMSSTTESGSGLPQAFTDVISELSSMLTFLFLLMHPGIRCFLTNNISYPAHKKMRCRSRKTRRHRRPLNLALLPPPT